MANRLSGSVLLALSLVSTGCSSSFLSTDGAEYVEQSTLAPVAPVIPRQFMGLNVGDTVHRSPSLQFGSLATNSRIQWAQTNPGQGIFNFTVLDQYISFGQKYEADIIFPLYDTPRWASSRPDAPSADGAGMCAPPSDMDYWDNYVSAVSAYVGKRIKYWTVGNEVQDSKYWCGDVQTLVTMVQHARNIILAVNPDAVIVAPSVTSLSTADLPNGPQMLAKFLAAGGGNYVDVISFHGYNTSTAEDLLPAIDAYKQVLAEAKVDLPLWDTEADWEGSGQGSAGSGQDGITDPAAQGAFLSKYFLLHWSRGVARFIWYEYDGGPFGGLVVDGGTYAETLAATAYGETYKWLVGASLNDPCTEASDGTWSCGLVRPGGYFARVMWISLKSKQILVPLGVNFYRDLYGVEHQVVAGATLTVDNQPILLESQALPK